jgi:uncharacterized damage-inducible protein DinB
MNLSTQMAKHFREVYFGGNWTSVNLKDALTDINWQQATTKVYSLNSIAALVYHINYYVSAVKKVFEGKTLDASDKYSFDLPSITSETDWQSLLDKTFADAESFAGLVEQLPEDIMGEIFVDEKYGTYYRNIHGIIEHIHYHLGQITVIKKILLTT